MTLVDLIHSVNKRLNRLRTIIRIIESDKFEFFYERLSDEDRQKIIQYIFNCDKIGLENFMQNRIRSELELLSLIDLRRLASIYKVPYYTRLDKYDLINHIGNIRDAIHKQRR